MLRLFTTNKFRPAIYTKRVQWGVDICLAIVNKGLVQLGMYAPNRSANDIYDRDLQRETDFDIDDLGRFVENNLSKLVPKQRIV